MRSSNLTPKDLLEFRITDLERAFHLYPGDFDKLSEGDQWRLIRYHELLTSNAEVQGVPAALFTINPLTQSQLLFALSKVMGGDEKNARRAPGTNHAIGAQEGLPLERKSGASKAIAFMNQGRAAAMAQYEAMKR